MPLGKDTRLVWAHGCRTPGRQVRPPTCTLAIVVLLTASVAIVVHFAAAVIVVLHVAAGVPCTLVPVECEWRVRGFWAPRMAVAFVAAC